MNTPNSSAPSIAAAPPAPIAGAPDAGARAGSVPARSAGGGDHSWLRATIPVALIAACAELGLAVINNSALPVYLTHGLGLDTVVLTNITVPFFLSEALFKSPLGMLADRWGRKPLMVIGPAVSIFTPLLIVAARYPPHTMHPWLLLLFGFLRLLDGLGAAALWPAMFAYIGDHVRQEKRASAMSVLNVTYMMGLAFGFLAGGWVNDTFGPVLSGEASLRQALHKVYGTVRSSVHKHVAALHHLGRHAHAANGANASGAASPGFHLHFHALTAHAQSVGIPVFLDRPAQFYPSFYFGSLLFALATIVALLGLKDRAADRREGIEERGKAGASAAASGDAAPEGEGEKITWAGFMDAVRSVPHLMLIALIAFFGIGCIMLLVKLFALDELGISETQFGLLVLWPALAIGALAVPLGRMSDRFGKVRSVRIGFLTAGAGMWLLVILYQLLRHDRGVGLIAGAGLLGIGFVIAFPAWMALLTMVGAASRRGTIVGAVSTAQGVGSIIGVEVGGWLYSHASRDPHVAHIAPFAVSAVLLTVAAGLTFVLLRPDAPADAAPAAPAPA